MLYYDVTNYYFESDVANELRTKGVSKEHHPKPIVRWYYSWMSRDFRSPMICIGEIRMTAQHYRICLRYGGGGWHALPDCGC
jgi:hypothetical protein